MYFFKLILYTIDCCGPVMWKDIIKISVVTSDEVIVVILCFYHISSLYQPQTNQPAIIGFNPNLHEFV